jgi:phosphoribosyl-ATP pyrophosphohydrolase/phosphoribosyl-AMP cyclohydrolase
VRRSWTKGEESEPNLVDIKNDERYFINSGKTSGTYMSYWCRYCWQTENKSDYGFISDLENHKKQEEMTEKKVM